MVNFSRVKREKIKESLDEIIDLLEDESQKRTLYTLESELFKKKFGLVWEEHYEDIDKYLHTHIPIFREVKERELVVDPNKEFNFILEGDNLHSLKLLEKTHKNKIDVIYIDPPYNTGDKDWKYNNDYIGKDDDFRHSKWISMMHNRLIVAKQLLTDDGVLICAIDINEIATLKLLLEEIFGFSYNVDCIAIIHNPRGKQGDNFSYTHEYALFVYKKGLKAISDRKLEESEITSNPLRNWGGESLRTDAQNCFYPIYVKDNEIIGFGDVLDDDVHPQKNEIQEDGSIAIYPIDNNGIERKWRYAASSVQDIIDNLEVVENNGVYDIKKLDKFAKYKSVWTDKKYDANGYGAQIINSMVPNNDFDYPKSIYNVLECLTATTSNKPNAIILDFFAGSGTTAHAVALLNKYDNGNRKFILATNNDMGLKKEKEFKKTIGEPVEHLTEWRQWEDTFGIASSITYPRVKAINDGFVHNKNFKEELFAKRINLTQFRNAESILETIEELKKENEDKYSEFKIVFEDTTIKLLGIYKRGEKIEGIPFNLKYYKTAFIKKNDDGSVSWRLLKYITELIQLQYHTDINNPTFKLILTEDELDALNEEDFQDCKTVFIPLDVFLTSQEEEMFKRLNITIIRIPKYYYNNELREIGEL